MARLENFRLVVFRAVAEQLSFRKAAEERAVRGFNGRGSFRSFAWQRLQIHTCIYSGMHILR
jgi:hypothetical protein